MISATEEDKNELFSLKETAKYNQKLYEIETRIAKDALIEKGFTILEDYPHTYLQVMNDKLDV